MRYPLVQRGLIALVQVLTMGVWFSASAVVPALAGLNRTMRPNEPAITITERTTA